MDVQDSIIDFNKICRLCLMEDSVMSSIYNETDKHSTAVPLPLRIMACVSIELNSIDGLPSQICTTCLCQVDGWYKFKDLCETADAILKKCVKNEPIQLQTISEIRSRAMEVKQFLGSPDSVKMEGLDSALNYPKAVKKPMKNVKKTIEDGVRRYKGEQRTSSQVGEEGEVEECEEMETTEEKSPETRDNGRPSEDSLDDESLANKLRSTSESDNVHESSSDDDMTLSAQKRKLLSDKSKPSRTKMKKKTGKTAPVAVRHFRTVQSQTGDAEGEGSVEIVEEAEAQAVVTKVERRRSKSRKTQTPRTQGGGKKRFRIRPAVPSSCTLCDKVYKNSEILRQHMKSHHVTGTIECPSCKLTFTSLRSLKYHEQRKHSNLEPVPCTFCGKKFLDKKYLRIHENIHSQTNHFVCQFCGRKFIMKTNLTVHISRHHTKKSNDFICQICGKAFPFKLYLKKHFKTHTDYKPYQCTYCEAKFRENTLLRKHVNSIHLKLRPFLCQYCHKTFTRSLYLREHMESQHLGIQRKVECSRCGETFQNRNRLRQHECLGRMDMVRIE